MPIFDLQCDTCSSILVDVYQRRLSDPVERPCGCGGTFQKTWLTHAAPSVSGDECDVWIRHGLCNLDGSPRRFTSKAEIARVAKEKGLTNVVQHKPAPGTDKNKHTQRWI